MIWYYVTTFMITLNITFTIYGSLSMPWNSGGIVGFSIETLTIALGVGVVGGLLVSSIASSQPTIGKYISSEKNVFYGFIAGLSLFFTTTCIYILSSIDAQFGLTAPLSIATIYTAIFAISSVMFILQVQSGGGWDSYK